MKMYGVAVGRCQVMAFSFLQTNVSLVNSGSERSPSLQCATAIQSLMATIEVGSASVEEEASVLINVANNGWFLQCEGTGLSVDRMGQSRSRF